MYGWFQDSVNSQAMWYAGYLSELYRIQKVGDKLTLPHALNGSLAVNHPSGKRPSRITVLVNGEKKQDEAVRAMKDTAGPFERKINAVDGDVEYLAVVDGIQIMVTGKLDSTVPEQTQSPTEEDVQHA